MILSSAVKCYPCREVPLNYSDEHLFHGGDTGSTPVRDANLVQAPIMTSAAQFKRNTKIIRTNVSPHLKKLLVTIAFQYPTELRQYALGDIDRTAFQIELVRKQKGTDITICDVGGSISLFSVACAALGMRSILIDKFDLDRDSVLAQVHRLYGVTVIQRDVVCEPPTFPPESLDVATSFDSIEHWHGSPKPVLHALKAALRPNGLFVIGVPNCVNLRKRITVPFGYGKWCTIQDWYEAPLYRSHVHEPDVDDLRYIARDLGLEDVNIYGRNWSGYISHNKFIRLGTRVVDRLLQLRPSLCSDLYLVGSL
jgi:SAM-dependent methyltransferase